MIACNHSLRNSSITFFCINIIQIRFYKSKMLKLSLRVHLFRRRLSKARRPFHPVFFFLFVSPFLSFRDSAIDSKKYISSVFSATVRQQWRRDALWNFPLFASTKTRLFRVRMREKGKLHSKLNYLKRLSVLFARAIEYSCSIRVIFDESLREKFHYRSRLG